MTGWGIFRLVYHNLEDNQDSQDEVGIPLAVDTSDKRDTRAASHILDALAHHKLRVVGDNLGAAAGCSSVEVDNVRSQINLEKKMALVGTHALVEDTRAAGGNHMRAQAVDIQLEPFDILVEHAWERHTEKPSTERFNCCRSWHKGEMRSSTHSFTVRHQQKDKHPAGA